MGCNCGDNEYNITVDNNGNCEPTTPIYNITLANVGVNGYSPIVRFINETVESFNIAVDNVTGTETSPAVPKLSYVADQINNVNNTIAGLSNTYLTKDGSNATNPISLNGLTIREQYGNLYISSNTLVSFSSNANPINIGGSSIDLTSTNTGRIRLLPSNGVILEGAENKNISLTTSGTGKAYYNGSEILTVNNLPDINTKLNTNGSNATNTFTVNGIRLANNEVYINNVASGSVSLTQTNSDIYANLGIDSNRAYLNMPSFVLSASPYPNRKTVINCSGDFRIDGQSNKFYYGSSEIANNEVAIKGDIPTYHGGEGITISSDNYIWLDYNSNKGLDVPEFSNSLAIKTDGDTISFDSDGALTIAPSLLASYVTNTSLATTLADYALISDIPDISTKQDILVSGTNIKTINNQSILGSGNIDIQGGTSYTAGTGINITNDTISTSSTVMTTDTAQTVTGDKTFSADIHLDGGSIRLDKTASHIYGKDTNNNYKNIIARSVSSNDITIGNQSDVLRFAGKLSYPKYNNVDMALLTDIPTVGNGTITINQGGTQKGTFTLNQSGNTTINLDAGGGGGATIDDTTPSSSTVYSSQKTQDLIDALVARIMALEANINGGNA